MHAAAAGAGQRRRRCSRPAPSAPSASASKPRCRVLQRGRRRAIPTATPGITARFRLAASLAELGRFAEAEQRYQEVVQKAGAKSIYRYTARLGLGEAQLAQGKA